MKQLLRRVLPARLYEGLRRFRDGTIRAFAFLIALPLRLLPTGLIVAIKERFETVRRMDYPRGVILLHLDSTIEYRARLRSCRKEPETVEWIEKFIRPGETIYDIGANVGAYSFVIDRFTGGKAVVYAFEPGFATFAQLSRNVHLNRCQGRIIPINVALADSNGLIRFNYGSLDTGAALHALGDPIDNKGRPFTPVAEQPVLAYRLDDFVSAFALAPPHHIKLDVDGIEHRILLGAPHTLAAPGLRTILVEMEPALESSRRITELLKARGFDLHSHRSHGDAPSDTANFLFVRQAPSGSA